VNSGRTASTRQRRMLVGLALLAATSICAQVPLSTESRTIQLASDSCQAVQIGDKISLDWNPNFDPSWPVTDLRGLGLTFAAVAEDGVNLKQTRLILDSRYTHSNISPLGNGFFHVAITVRPRSKTTRVIRPGTYRLVKARAIAALDTSYTGGPPQMTSSPVEARYCITILRSSSSASPKSGDE